MAVIFAPKKLSDFKLTGHQYCCNYSLQDGTAPDGTAAIRYELRKTDADISGSKRTEAELPSNADSPLQGERWYGHRYWFDTYDKDNAPESIFQFHDGDGKTTPPLSIQVNNGRLRLMQSFLDTGNVPYDIGALETGKWVSIVLHVIWATDKTGLLELWKDGVKVVSVKNVITNAKSGNYTKYGLNKWSWQAATLWSQISTPRIFFMTDVKIGNETSSYNEVAPGAIVVVPPPPPPPNQPPIAVAGADQTIKLPVNDVVLKGDASSDPDGKIASYQWQENGLSVGTGADIQVNDLAEGVHTFTLSVIDDKGAKGTDTMQVTVLPADPLPVPKIVSTTTTTEIDFDNGAKEFWVNGVKQ